MWNAEGKHRDSSRESSTDWKRIEKSQDKLWPNGRGLDDDKTKLWGTNSAFDRASVAAELEQLNPMNARKSCITDNYQSYQFNHLKKMCIIMTCICVIGIIYTTQWAYWNKINICIAKHFVRFCWSKLFKLTQAAVTHCQYRRAAHFKTKQNLFS